LALLVDAIVAESRDGFKMPWLVAYVTPAQCRVQGGSHRGVHRPDVSIAAMAVTHVLDANSLRKWVIDDVRVQGVRRVEFRDARGETQARRLSATT
jgi:hypothetical protein